MDIWRILPAMGFLSTASPRRSLLGAVLLFCLGAGLLPAQDSIHPSLAGAYAAAATRPAMDTSDYNLKLGPAVIKLTDSFNIELNDNINLTQSDRKADLLLEPFLDARAFWQFSELNSLSFNLGIGYIQYLQNPQLNRLDVVASPDSNLALSIFVGDFRFTVFERLSIQEDPVPNIHLSNVATYPRVENALGLTVVWDLNQLVVFGGYAHYTFSSLSSQFASQNNSQEQFFVSAGLKLNPSLIVGLRGTFAAVNYTQNVQPNSVQTSYGVYTEARLTPYLNLSAEGGYQTGTFAAGSLNNDGSQLGSFYARLNLVHRLNRYWTDTLTLGREAELGMNTNYTEVNYLSYAATWRVNSRLTLDLHANYENGIDSSGNAQAQKIQQLSYGFSFNRQLGRKINFHAGYDFVNHITNLANQNYYQSRLVVGFSYAF
jgi:hypothetical protein